MLRVWAEDGRFFYSAEGEIRVVERKGGESVWVDVFEHGSTRPLVVFDEREARIALDFVKRVHPFLWGKTAVRLSEGQTLELACTLHVHGTKTPEAPSRSPSPFVMVEMSDLLE